MDVHDKNKYIHLKNIKRSVIWYTLFSMAFISCFITTKFIQQPYIAETLKISSGYTIIALLNVVYCSGLMTCYLVENYIIYPLCEMYVRL